MLYVTSVLFFLSQSWVTLTMIGDRILVVVVVVMMVLVVVEVMGVPYRIRPKPRKPLNANETLNRTRRDLTDQGASQKQLEGRARRYPINQGASQKQLEGRARRYPINWGTSQKQLEGRARRYPIVQGKSRKQLESTRHLADQRTSQKQLERTITSILSGRGTFPKQLKSRTNRDLKGCTISQSNDEDTEKMTRPAVSYQGKYGDHKRKVNTRITRDLAYKHEIWATTTKWTKQAGHCC